MGARRALIELQKEVLETLKADVRALSGPTPASLRRYYHDYKRVFRGYRRLVSRDELVQEILRSDIAYLGDYHTLRQSQRTALRILRHLVERKRLVLALEMVMARHQDVLDAYTRSEISDRAFLEQVDYARSWGFDWNHYRPLLEFAREHRIPVVALNSQPYEEKVGLAARDRFAARIIARLTVEHPDALVFVLFGDLHLAPGHLPARVDEILSRQKTPRRRTIVYQNSETLYWKLTAQGLEHTADVLELRPGFFCVMNTAPWVKLQSYLHWHRQAPELTSKTLGTEVDEADPDDVIHYDEEVDGLCRIVARFLNIEGAEAHDLEVYTLDDLSFLDRMRRDERHGMATRLVRARESFFLPDLRLLYLSSLSVNRAAEEAGIYLLYQCSRVYPTFGPGKEAFYERVFARALGYLASKLVNHKRKCSRLRDHERALERLARKKKLSRADRILRDVARAILRHQARMAQAAKAGGRVHFPAIYAADPPAALCISRGIGMLYGDALFTALIQGRITRDEVRGLFYIGRSATFDALAALLKIHRRTEDVAVDFESKDDYF
jgi:hypothetical protein